MLNSDVKSISIHAPTKGATLIGITTAGIDIFQSTLPRRERRIQEHYSTDTDYFNPRSHEGSDGLPFVLVIVPSISIHAPTKGATLPFQMCRCISKISIHAPTKGATLVLPSFTHLLDYFNPRSHEGSDKISHGTIQRLGDFNPRSHEGSDKFLRGDGWVFENFNPRSHEGSDLFSSPYLSIYSSFQSTLPRRERLESFSTFVPLTYFNPRSHEGSDLAGYSLQCLVVISIHAPTKGATVKRRIFTWILIFQSTLPRRERQSPFLQLPLINFISIHAPTKGATLIYHTLHRFESISIHAPTKGATII